MVARVISIAAPTLVIAVVALVDYRAGIAIGVLIVGMAAASVVYVKNRTDRHNAAVRRGEIRSLPDPGFSPVAPTALPPDLVARTTALGHPAADLGAVLRFDQGWVVRRRTSRGLAVVIGDDGGWARFDPRTVTNEWAVAEYLAGRGRDG